MAESEFKYIAVYNWGNYQERIKGMGVRRPFIRDSVTKDSDPDYSQLSPTERYTLDGCRRLIGLHGRNLPNDPTWICRALVVGSSHRGHVGVAVRSLIGRGLLLLTNQRDPFATELNRTEVTEETSTAVAVAGGQEQASPVNDEQQVEENPELVRYWAEHVSNYWPGKPITPANFKKVAAQCSNYFDKCGAAKRKAVIKAWETACNQRVTSGPPAAVEVELPESKAFMLED
jgi:hypothetical protein